MHDVTILFMWRQIRGDLACIERTNVLMQNNYANTLTRIEVVRPPEMARESAKF